MGQQMVWICCLLGPQILCYASREITIPGH